MPPPAIDARRRRIVAVLSGLLAPGLAGCVGTKSPGTGESERAGTTAGSRPSPGSGPTPVPSEATAEPESTGSPTAGGALDFREANVTGVDIERRNEEIRFAVTLYHDDDGEAGYANWWQVETLDGERLGRRKLRHAHGTREFTRSATVGVPADVGCVVVRGHDELHGYGGQAMLVSLEDGDTRAVRQGSDPVSARPADCL